MWGDVRIITLGDADDVNEMWGKSGLDSAMGKPGVKVMQDGLLWVWFGDTTFISNELWDDMLVRQNPDSSQIALYTGETLKFGPFLIQVVETSLIARSITIKRVGIDLLSRSQRVV